MTQTIDSLKAMNPRQGELVLVKYRGVEKKEMGQIASDGSFYNQPIFDEVNNCIYVHFRPQSFPSALKIDKIEFFQLISKIPMTVEQNSDGLTYTYKPVD